MSLAASAADAIVVVRRPDENNDDDNDAAAEYASLCSLIEFNSFVRLLPKTTTTTARSDNV